jgi:hypothetical protein
MHNGILLYADTDNPLKLYFDHARSPGKPLQIQARYLPGEAGSAGSLAMQEWNWANGPAGAGTTVETPASYEGGGSEYGKFVWLRRQGVATAAGALVEYPLPTMTAGFRAGQFMAGQMYGDSLWITTIGRTVIEVPGAAVGAGIREQDFGLGAQTMGIGVFAGTGSSCLYVGEFNTAIREYNGSAWADGEAGTNRQWLETPNWTLGNQLATGGLAGLGGRSADRLVGTDQLGTGFYHVAGDPKVEANWSALEKVGTGGTKFPISRTAASNHEVWFGTGMGVRGYDGSGRSANLTKWMELSASINNCASIAFWNGLIWTGHESGLLVFAPTGERIDLGQYVQFGGRTGGKLGVGRPIAMAPSPDGLYVGYWNQDNQTTYIGCLVVDPDGTYRWSMAEAVIEGEIVTYLQQAIDTNGDPGLFIGTLNFVDRSLHLYRQYLPKYGDPIADALHGASFRAATDWELTLSRWDGGRPVPKTLRRFSGEFDYLGDDYPDNTVDFRVSIDGGDFVSQGAAPSGADTAGPSLRWTSTPRASYVRGTNVQIRLGVHNTATAPVVVNSVGVRYTPHPEQIKVTTYPIILSEEHTGGDPKIDLGRLERATRDGPITYIDQLGNTCEGTVEPDLNEVYEQGDPGASWVVHADVTISNSRVVTRYDAGYRYDRDAAYS